MMPETKNDSLQRIYLSKLYSHGEIRETLSIDNIRDNFH
jgi:hypothetical protein